MNWFWLILALAAVAASGYLIGYSSRTPRAVMPDWFWNPSSGWEWSIRWAGDDTEPEADSE